MKIRTDFVTNSSSSSFVLMLEIKLKNGRVYSFRGVGSCGEGAENEFDECLNKAAAVINALKMADGGIE